MEPLSLTTSTTTSFSINRFPPAIFSSPSRLRNSNYCRNRRFIVLSSKDDPKLNQWDLMELKFGKMLGEDPKLTLAKIMGKKLNPDATFMEIEKSFYKKKGNFTIEEIPLDWAKKDEPLVSSNKVNLTRPVPRKVQSSDSLKGLNLVRPVPKKGVKFEVDVNANSVEIKKPSQPIKMEIPKPSLPNVILRKPYVHNEVDEDSENISKLRIKRNLSLSMGNNQTKQTFSDMTLLRKPQPISVRTDDIDDVKMEVRIEQSDDRTSDITLLKKPEVIKINTNLEETKAPSGAALPIDEIEDDSLRDDVILEILEEKPENKARDDLTLLTKPEAKRINTNLEETRAPSITTDAVLPIDEIEDDSIRDDIKLEMLKETFENKARDIPLMKKPGVIRISTKLDEIKTPSVAAETEPIDENKDDGLSDDSDYGDVNDTTTNSYEESVIFDDGSFSTEDKLEDDFSVGLQPPKQSNKESLENEISVTESSDTYVGKLDDTLTIESALQGRPKRLDQSVKEISNSTKVKDIVSGNLESIVKTELENFVSTSPSKESEDIDWRRVEDQVKTGGREEVELISCSTRGFVVSCGSLIGFLPYRNLAAKWKFLAFESWLRRKGLDPSIYRQSLRIIGTYDAANKNALLESNTNQESENKSGELSLTMKLEELLSIYDQEKIKFLSSFVGQKIKVNVLIADKKSRKLIFSIRPKEKDEFVEKKRSLMAKLSIGDVVECCIKKITYFGIFVEVEGVPALIHQTEVSWDTTLNPASYYKIGQIVEAKVHQLDFSLERIFLSLKEISPDPLIEALESVVGDPNSLDGRLEAAQPDSEWTEVESLIKELQQIEGIQSVSKGRYFLSPGLAPTFQVYMASMFENQYKLLARSENKVQEVIVEASLDKEEMKSAILTCASRVDVLKRGLGGGLGGGQTPRLGDRRLIRR